MYHGVGIGLCDIYVFQVMFSVCTAVQLTVRISMGGFVSCLVIILSACCTVPVMTCWWPCQAPNFCGRSYLYWVTACAAPQLATAGYQGTCHCYCWYRWYPQVAMLVDSLIVVIALYRMVVRVALSSISAPIDPYMYPIFNKHTSAS